MSKGLRIGFFLVITAIFFVYIVWTFDQEGAWDKAAEALKKAKWLFFIPMFFGYLLSHLLRSLRLWILMEKSPRYSRVFVINTLGFLAINVLPFRMGEMVRPYLLSEDGEPFSKGLAAILLERMLDLFMLLLMLLLLAWAVDLPAQGIQIKVGSAEFNVITAAQNIAGFLVVIGLSGCACVLFFGERVISLLTKLPKGEKIASFARIFRQSISALFQRPLRAFGLVLLSVVVWTCTIGAVYAALLSIPDLPQGWDVALSTWTITLAGMTAVPTPGFLLIYELSCAEALKLWQADPALAMTFAALLHLGQFLFIAVLGGYFSIREGVGLRRLARDSQKSEM